MSLIGRLIILILAITGILRKLDRIVQGQDFIGINCVRRYAGKGGLWVGIPHISGRDVCHDWIVKLNGAFTGRARRISWMLLAGSESV